MGRLTKAKIDEIARLRKQGYTQKETAEKLNVHIRTVRKYDPLREKKPVMPTAEQDRQHEESCSELAAEGLLHRESDGRFRISFWGKRPTQDGMNYERRLYSSLWQKQVDQ